MNSLWIGALAPQSNLHKTDETRGRGSLYGTPMESAILIPEAINARKVELASAPFIDALISEW